MIQITRYAVDPKAFTPYLEDQECGAVTCFEGRVRRRHQGKEVVALEYSCHETMALRQMEKLAGQARARWKTGPIVAVHRVGPVPMGEIAVWIAVATGHRGEAFEACRWLIDHIKHDVPIWKLETYTDGTQVWQEGCRCVPALPVENPMKPLHSGPSMF